MDNVYYSPEKFGLQEVMEINYCDAPYEFDFRVIWKDKHGTLWTAKDSGCSCPAPFEDYNGLDDLERVHLPYIKSELDESGGYGRVSFTPDEKKAILDKIKWLQNTGQAGSDEVEYY
jgi:hypothetical protein